MLHLLCVPAGYRTAGLFTEKARRRKYEDTILVASSNALVQKLRMQAVNAVNFDYLANAILDQCNPGHGGRRIIQRISRKTQELIIQDILDRLLQENRLSYFGRLVHKKGFILSITSLMDQLGGCGASTEEITTAFAHWEGRSGSQRQKDREISEIYREYISYLISHDVYDVAGLYRLAVEELDRLLKSGGRLKWDTVFFMGFYQFDALQLDMIRSLSRLCDVRIALSYEGNRPELYGATEFTYGELMGQAVREQLPQAVAEHIEGSGGGFVAEAAPLQGGESQHVAIPGPENMPEVSAPSVYLKRKPSLQQIVNSLRNPKAKPATPDGSIEIWQTGDREGEMRAVLRDIKKLLREQKVKPEEVAVVVRRMEDYSGIRSLCDAYGIPVQMEDSASVAANPVFRYILSVLETVPLHGRDKAESWTAFLTSPLQKLALDLSPEVAAQLAGGRYYTDYKVLLSDMLQQMGSSASLILQQQRDCGLSQDMLQPAKCGMSQKPCRQTGCGALQELWRQIEMFPQEAPVQEYCDRVNGILSLLDLQRKAGRLYKKGELSLVAFKNIACACQAIEELLEKLPRDYRVCGHEHRTITCSQFAEALTEAAETMLISLQPENLEGIAVLPAVNLEEAAFKQVYVMGLREKEFPFFKNENWIFTDSERADLAALGITLPASADGFREDIRFFFNACAAAEERLVLTFYADEEHNASPYIAEIRSLFTGLPVQVKKAQTDAADSLSREELELALARAGRRKDLQQLEPGLAEAGDSDRKRANGKPEWNGNFIDASLIRQISQQTGNRFSASKLETYRSCPFKFLVTYVWRQQVAEAAGEDIDPMQRGNLLHRVLESFVQNHLEEQLQASRYAVLLQELDAIFDKTWQELAEKGLLYPGDFWQHDKELQRILLHRWLQGEIAYSEAGALCPVFTELEFGRTGTGDMALEVNGRTIYLNGKIDRIDRAGNMYFVTDYKSGDAPKSNAFADTDLQLPLYLLAAERLLAAPAGGAVAGGGYLSLKAGERKESFLLPGTELKLPGKTFTEMKDADGNSLPVADMQDLQVKMINVLTELLERMEQGDFTPTPVSGCDKHCPGAAVCRYRVLVRDREEEGSDG